MATVCSQEARERGGATTAGDWKWPWGSASCRLSREDVDEVYVRIVPEVAS